MIYLVFLSLLLLLGILGIYYGVDSSEYPPSAEEELARWGVRWDEVVTGPLSNQNPHTTKQNLVPPKELNHEP